MDRMPLDKLIKKAEKLARALNPKKTEEKYAK